MNAGEKSNIHIKPIVRDDLVGKMVWGCNPSPVGHLAFIGLRACDNPKRQFEIFSNRVTRLGDPGLLKILASYVERKGLNTAKSKTHYSYGLESLVAEVREKPTSKSPYTVTCRLRTSGEYLYASFYLDRDGCADAGD